MKYCCVSLLLLNYNSHVLGSLFLAQLLLLLLLAASLLPSEASAGYYCSPTSVAVALLLLLLVVVPGLSCIMMHCVVVPHFKNRHTVAVRVILFP